MYLSVAILSPLCALLFTVASCAPNPVPVERRATGSLSLDTSKESFTFNYETSDPYSTNWIGLYPASGGGPDNEEYVQPSSTWEYAPESKGSVKLNVGSLQPGNYKAYFLARDGYKWLANPVTATLQAPPAKLYYPVESATLHNARRGEAYSAKIDGLVLGKGSDTVTYKKTGGDSWIQVASNGALSGTPGTSSADSSQVTVQATASSGSTAVIRFTVPVKQATARLVSDLKVMTFNLWHGGTQVNNYHEKQLRFILGSGADIITFQEATGGHTARLGNALGWFSSSSSSGDVGIISRYPILEKYKDISVACGARINLNGNKSGDPVELNVWNAHLGYTPYGPYDFCYDKMTKDQVTKREAQSGRTPQITEILKGIDSQLSSSSKTPVLLTGDFNAPSHLDWVPSLQQKNCGVAQFDWPTSILPTQRGLIDSFRVAHPDPKAVQATTWSTVFPKHDGATGKDEPQDRIDFIYHTKDRLTVAGSERLVQGSPAPSPGHKDNEWTSDHAAVMTQYRIV